MKSSLIIPITFWSCSKPTFRISSICVTPNFEKVVTGTYEGRLCIWDLNVKMQTITPRIILIGHEYSVICTVSSKAFFISSSESGKMCKWNLEDGYCDKVVDSALVHRNMQLFRHSTFDKELLFVCGDYSGIFIYHPVTLQIICHLTSTTDCPWISNFHAISLENEQNIVVSGITVKGHVKTWMIDNNLNKSLQETHSNNLSVEKVVDLKYNMNRTLALIITLNYWCLYDADFFICISKIEAVQNQRLLGGNFCDNNDIIIWTNSGNFFLYREKNNKQELITLLQNDSFNFNMFLPALTVKKDLKNEIYIFKGDSNGKISIWLKHKIIKEPFISVKPTFSTAFGDNWLSFKKSLLKSMAEISCATCCVYILEIDKFFIGCLNGNIISISAMQTVKSFYLCSSDEKTSYIVLHGHKRKVTCLLYPYANYSHYNKAYLVSGGGDFSVCLWNIYKMELLHKFCVQSGQILKLIVPPSTCSLNVRHSICSISSDNSVAVLNLKDKRCIILTSRHTFPVITVNWKPLDGFMIIECFDGTVYVWETETGLLDRVLNGLHGQEVIYACHEDTFSNCLSFNFDIDEQKIMNNCLSEQIFKIRNDYEFIRQPVLLSGFANNEKSENHIFLCHPEYLIEQIISNHGTASETSDFDVYEKTHFATQGLHSESVKKSSEPNWIKPKNENEIENENESHKIISQSNKPSSNAESNLKNANDYLSALSEVVEFYLSALHVWGLNSNIDESLLANSALSRPVCPPTLGIVSLPGIYSLYLPIDGNTSELNSSLLTTTCIIMMSLSKVFEYVSSLCNFNCLGVKKERMLFFWNDLYSFYENVCLNSNNDFFVPKPKIEIFARTWLSRCTPMRNIARQLLPIHLDALPQEDYNALLGFWYNFLPHFNASGKSDSDNIDLKKIALLLFGIVGSDLKFKVSNLTCQENYVYQTCASFIYLLLLSNKRNSQFNDLLIIAIDFIGRGYIVWEQFLKVEKIFPVLFRLCTNMMLLQMNGDKQKCLDIPIAAYEALKAIAIARTSAFISCLINQINKIGNPNMFRHDDFSIKNSKPEILSIITFLLEKTPFIMLLYLNEVISIFLFCIDSTHLKQKSLPDVLPVMTKFRQVHHSVSSQRIAVGLGTGYVVVHDLKTGKTASITAHKDSVSAVKFSLDGKYLASYSCYENNLSFWQVATGIFGLGQVSMKFLKTYKTYQIHDEEIRNHLEIADLSWVDNKSVLLRLCDGTESVFHF